MHNIFVTQFSFIFLTKFSDDFFAVMIFLFFYNYEFILLQVRYLRIHQTSFLTYRKLNKVTAIKNILNLKYMMMILHHSSIYTSMKHYNVYSTGPWTFRFKTFLRGFVTKNLVCSDSNLTSRINYFVLRMYGS